MWETAPSGGKIQRLDLDQIASPLKAFPDVPEQGGTPGHVAIAPVNEAGEIDMDELKEWAACRSSGQTHPLTQILLDAIVELIDEGSPQ